MRKENSPSIGTTLQKFFFEGPMEPGVSDRGRERRRGLSRFVLLIFLLFLAGRFYRYDAQEVAPPHPNQSTPEQKTPNPSIKVEVDLVLINATVTDPSNRFVTGLEKEHFQLFETRWSKKSLNSVTKMSPLPLACYLMSAAA